MSGCFPDVFLPGTSPWKRAFLGTLVGLPLLLALLMMLVLYFFRKQRKSQGTRQSGGCPPGIGFAKEKSGRGGHGGGVGKAIAEGLSCRAARREWDLENRQRSARTDLCSPLFFLSEKLKKQAERDKGKREERWAFHSHL